MDTNFNFYDLISAITSVTINPARVLEAESEIGTLKIGSRADISILNLVEGCWLLFDSIGKQLVAKQKLAPFRIVRLGELIQQNCRLLRDFEYQCSEIDISNQQLCIA
ncbi:hypothetical protein NIES4071_18320 [Calothrix sp. NIES-4071]|nr:hypothetical protein NIES4071_18320 [Calothrix sp. NIES-4071]BAZ56165.1 hypothetical protein NIES4105_18270 [Calothrix sp. NIES-4105]